MYSNQYIQQVVNTENSIHHKTQEIFYCENWDKMTLNNIKHIKTAQLVEWTVYFY